MPSKAFYIAFEVEILGITRTNIELEKLKSSCAKMISRMMKQGDTEGRTKATSL